jgi:hypothetical protein
MAKQLFGNLVKVSTTVARKNEDYDAKCVPGNLVFANITGEGETAGKYIYANGIEYKIADATNLDELIRRVADVSNGLIDLSTFVRETVEPTLADLSTYVYEDLAPTVADLSSRLSPVDTSLKDHENRIKTLEDASYVHTLGGDDYVSFSTSTGDVVASIKIGDIATATVDASGLATAHDVSAFVMGKLGDLSNALVFKGGVNDSSLLPTSEQKVGDTYVATSNMHQDPADPTSAVIADEGDMFIWNGADWTHVERNLDGAVTSGEVLADGYMIQGKGAQSVGTSTVSLTSLVDVSNNAVRTVVANSSTTTYLAAEYSKNGTQVDISYGIIRHDVSTAAADADGVATAKDVKDYVDAVAGDVKVQATLNSSTSNYIDASATVDAAGRVIAGEVGAKVISLNDASQGAHGLADANDVYTELTAVEEVMATANTTMANTLGMDSSFGVTWTDPAWAGKTYKEAIETAAAAAGVTEIGGVTGAIGLTGATNAGDVSLSMVGQNLKAEIKDLDQYVATAIDSSIKALDVTSTEVANKVLVGVSETDGKVASTAAGIAINGVNFEHAVNDASLIATIDGSDIKLDKSVADSSTVTEKLTDYETRIHDLEDSSYVTTLKGDDYVKVDHEDGDIQLSTVIGDISTATADASGLATAHDVSAFVEDRLSWEVIGN